MNKNLNHQIIEFFDVEYHIEYHVKYHLVVKEGEVRKKGVILCLIQRSQSYLKGYSSDY